MNKTACRENSCTNSNFSSHFIILVLFILLAIIVSTVFTY